MGEDVARGSRWGLDYLLLALAGLGMWASFPFVGAWYLLPVSLAVLISVVDRVSVGRASWYGFVAGWGFFLAHIWWATVAVGSYLPWAVLAGIQGLFMGAWTGTVAWLRPLRAKVRWIWVDALIVGLSFAGMEQLRSRIPFGGFPWALVGYSQVDGPLGHLAPWGSEVTIAVAVVVLATLARRIFSLVSWQRPRHWFSRPLAAGLGVAVGVLPILLPLPASQQDGAVRVGIIQGNVEPPVDETFAVENKVAGNHTRTTLEAVKAGLSADLVVWGENSLDRDARVNRSAMELVRQASNAVAVPLLVGAVRHEDEVRFNDAVLYYPGGKLGPVYTKQKPVPFGEYIPMRDFLSILSKETARVSSDMVGGTEPGLLDVTLNDGRKLPLAVGICFESAYEEIFAEPVRSGAQVIVVPTNNSAFGMTAESLQQLQMVRLRAMSLSRSAMQVSTNGVSALVRPNGAVVASTDLFTSAWREAELPLRHEVTFSARFKPVVDVAAMVFWGAVVVLGAGARRATRPRPAGKAAPAKTASRRRNATVRRGRRARTNRR